METKTYFSKKPLGHFNQVLYVGFQIQGNEINHHDAGQMIKTAVMHI